MTTRAQRDYALAQRAVVRANDRLAKARDAMQAECTHPIDGVVQGEALIDPSVRIPPFRVCVTCGLAEAGWGGYSALHPSEDVRVVPRNSAHAYVIGPVVAQAEHAARRGG